MIIQNFIKKSSYLVTLSLIKSVVDLGTGLPCPYNLISLALKPLSAEQPTDNSCITLKWAKNYYCCSRGRMGDVVLSRANYLPLIDICIIHWLKAKSRSNLIE